MDKQRVKPVTNTSIFELDERRLFMLITFKNFIIANNLIYINHSSKYF